MQPGEVSQHRDNREADIASHNGAYELSNALSEYLQKTGRQKTIEQQEENDLLPPFTVFDNSQSEPVEDLVGDNDQSEPVEDLVGDNDQSEPVEDLAGDHTLAELEGIADDQNDPNSAYAQLILDNETFLRANGAVTGLGEESIFHLDQVTNTSTEFSGLELQVTGGPYTQDVLEDGTIIWRDQQNHIRRIEADGSVQTIEWDGDTVKSYTDADGHVWFVSPYKLWAVGEYISDSFPGVFYKGITVSEDGVVSLVNAQTVKSARGDTTFTYENPYQNATIPSEHIPSWGTEGIIFVGPNGSIEHITTEGHEIDIHRDLNGTVIVRTDWNQGNNQFSTTYANGMEITMYPSDYRNPNNLPLFSFPIESWSILAFDNQYYPVAQQIGFQIGITYDDGSTYSVDHATQQWFYTNGLTGQTFPIETPTLDSINVSGGNTDTYVIQMSALPPVAEGIHGAQARFDSEGRFVGLRGLDGSPFGRVEVVNDDFAVIDVPGENVVYEMRDGVWYIRSTDPVLDGTIPDPPPEITTENGRIQVVLPSGRHFDFAPDGSNVETSFGIGIEDGVRLLNQTRLGDNGGRLTEDMWVSLPGNNVIKYDTTGLLGWGLYRPGPNGDLIRIASVAFPVVQVENNEHFLSFNTDYDAPLTRFEVDEENQEYTLLLMSGASQTFTYDGAPVLVTRHDRSTIEFENGRPAEIVLQVNQADLPAGFLSPANRIVLTRQTDGTWRQSNSDLTLNVNIEDSDFGEIEITDPAGNAYTFSSAGNIDRITYEPTTVSNPETGETTGLEDGEVTPSTEHAFPTNADDESSSVAQVNGMWVFTATNEFKLTIGPSHVLTTDSDGNLYSQGRLIEEINGEIPLDLGGGATLFQAAGLVTRIELSEEATINFTDGVPSSLSLDEGDNESFWLIGNGADHIAIPPNTIPVGWLTSATKSEFTWTAAGITYTVDLENKTITASTENNIETFSSDGVLFSTNR